MASEVKWAHAQGVPEKRVSFWPIFGGKCVSGWGGSSGRFQDGP